MICELHNAGMDVKTACMKVMCGPPRRASELFAADAELAPHREKFAGPDFAGISVGGGAPICEECSKTVTELPSIKCRPAPGIALCSGVEICIDPGAGHQDDEKFDSPTTIDGFEISASGETIYQEMGQIGLALPPSAGVSIALPKPGCLVRVTVGSGTKSPVEVEALDHDGKRVAAQQQPDTHLRRYEAVLAAPDIRTIRVSGGPESVLYRVCVKG